MLILALIGISKKIKTGIPLALKLLLLLSVFSITWGVLTCSWFGVDTELLPQFLRDISLSYLSTAKTDPLTVDQNLLFVCFTIGLVHLCLAHIIRIKHAIRERSPTVLAEIGAMGMIWGIYNVVLFLMVSNELRTFPIHPVSLYILIGGFVLNFIFSAYEVSIKQSILDGLKNFISVILGVTGVFSDVMSYIRLWAVGIAGMSISMTVNTMAGPLLGNFLIFLGIILMVFGHGLNMVINVLSVLVHGIRLNTLEFSGHLKLTWSGTAYKPFAVKR
jgi:V/A-type H+-transporting ATPase subunit I